MNYGYVVAKAESGGLEALVWILLAIVWSVVQLIAKSRKTGQQTAPPPTHIAQKKPLQKELEQFFEELANSSQGTVDPVIRTAPPPPPAPRIAKPMPAVLTETPPRKPRTQRRRPAPEPEALPIPAAVEERIHFNASVISGYDYSAISRSQQQSMPRNLFLSGRGLKFPSIPLSCGSGKARPAYRSLFGSKSALKRAYVARVAFGTPRGLQRQDFTGE